jgi:vacuolar-type H+-ATPase subunit I/STV1
MTTHGLDTTLLVFAISLLIGGFAISVGAKLAFKSRDYSHAVLTALLGAVAWGLVDAAFARLGVQGALASVVGLPGSLPW